MRRVSSTVACTGRSFGLGSRALYSTGTPPAAPSVDKMHVLFYTYVEDMMTKRVPYRAAHLAYAQRFVDEGSFVAGGAWEDASGSMLVLRTSSADDAHNFARDDPYVKAGLVTRHEVRPWLVVAGTAKKEPSL